MFDVFPIARNLYPDQTVPRREDAIQPQERRTMLSSKFPICPLGPNSKHSSPEQPHLSEVSLPMRNFTCEYEPPIEERILAWLYCDDVYNWLSCTKWRLNEMIANLHDDFGDEGFKVRESVWLHYEDVSYITYMLANLHDDFGDAGFDGIEEEL